MVQIDVKNVDTQKNLVECSLYTGDRCVKMYISAADYEELVRDGFFIRDGKNRDSANVLNTTKEYHTSKSF